jgi:hypothetical protein
MLIAFGSGAPEGTLAVGSMFMMKEGYLTLEDYNTITKEISFVCNDAS